MSGKIAGIYVEIRGDSSHLKKELATARGLVTQQAQGMSNALNNALSPAQLKSSINGLVRDLNVLSNSSKLTGKEFSSLGADLGELRRLTGMTEQQFQSLQSKLLQTGAANAQEKALRNIAKAANLTKTEIQSLGSQMGVSQSVIAKVANPAEKAGGGMAMLAGGAKTVAAAFGVLSGVMITQQIIEFGKAVIDAGIAVDSLNRSYAAIFGGTQQAAREFEFVRKTALDTGQSFYTIADSYKQISASAKDTVLEGEPARQLFLAMSQAGAVLGLSNERMALSFKAFSDMMSKGTVQMEELKNQLGDNLPGALNIAAKGLGITRAEVLALAKDGKLMASEVIPAMTQELQRMYAVAANDAALNSARAATNRLSDAWTDLKANLFDSQAFVVATNSLANMTKAIGGFFAADTLREKYTAAQDNLKGLEQVEGTPMASLPGFSGSIAKARKEVALLKAELDAVSNPLKADSWLSRDKGLMYADERSAGALEAMDKGRQKMLEYIQTAKEKAAVERDTHLEFARTQEERTAILKKYADTVAALDKKESAPGMRAAKAAEEAAKKFQNSIRDVNKEFAEVTGDKAAVWLASWEDRYQDLYSKIMQGKDATQRDASLARLKAADEATRTAIAAGYQTMVDARTDLEAFRNEMKAFQAIDDANAADRIKMEERLSKLQGAGQITTVDADAFRAAQNSEWNKEISQKNLETQREFYKEYIQIAGDGFAVIEQGILNQADVFKKAKISEADIAKWVEYQKLQYSTEWQDGAKRALHEYTMSAKDSAAAVESVMNTAFQGMEDMIVEFVKTGKFEFADFVTSINAEIARLAFKDMAGQMYSFLGSMMGGVQSSSGGTDWLGTALNLGISTVGSHFGGGSSAAGSAGGGFNYAGEMSSFFSTHHSGGIVGSEATSMRMASPMLFAGASRFHSGGLIGDEVPIIAKRGEGVFTEGQMRALGGGVGSSEMTGLLRELVAVSRAQKATKVVNAIGKGAIANELSGSEGEQVIFNHIRRNPSAVRRMLGL